MGVSGVEINTTSASGNHLIELVGFHNALDHRAKRLVFRIHPGHIHAKRPGPSGDLHSDAAHADDQRILAHQLNALVPWPRQVSVCLAAQ